MRATTPPPSAPRRPTEEQVQRVLQEIDRLPTLSPVALRLLRLTADLETQLDEIVSLIQTDAALTTALLSLANRVDGGLRSGVVSIPRVVTHLGYRRLRNAVLAVQVYGVLPKPDPEREAQIRRRGLWLHNLAVACAAELLTDFIPCPYGDDQAFVAGLLHDIGKIALDSCFPKSYARVVERWERGDRSACDAELEVLGIDHTTVGRRLAQRWRLPEPLASCIWLHHQESEMTIQDPGLRSLVQLVQFADQLARRYRIGTSHRRILESTEQLAGGLGMSLAQVEATGKAITERVAQECELLGLEEATSITVLVESLSQANRELADVNHRLTESNEQLRRRSAVFEAMSRFTFLLVPTSDLVDVGRSAAQSIQSLLQVPSSVVCFRDGQRLLTHAGFADGTSGVPTRPADLDGAGGRVLDAADDEAFSNQWESMLFRGASDGASWHQGEEGSLSIWRQVMGTAPRGTLWYCMMTAPPRFSWAVLVDTTADTVPTFHLVDREEWAALTALITQTAWAVVARVDSERLTEDLLMTSRRMHEGHADAVRARSVRMIGAMAAGAAHELNTPLSVISGRAQLLLTETGDPKVRQSLTTIVEKAHEASRIVSELMDFAKPNAPQPETCNLADILGPLFQRWRERFGRVIESGGAHPTDPRLRIHVDREHLEWILTALVQNAVESAGDRPVRVQVNSASRSTDETVRVEVADNGRGMEPEVLEHCLDPFYSSRPAGRGRGLGLSRAYRLTELNGGQLWIDTHANEGTRAIVEFPVRPPPP